MLDVFLQQVPNEVGSALDVGCGRGIVGTLLKTDRVHLLDELERVSRRVIVSTPNRYFVQSPYDGNIHQRHLSNWTVQDFRRRNYSVLGVGNLMILGREIKYLSYAFSRMTLPVPALSSCIMAVYQAKRASNRRATK